MENKQKTQKWYQNWWVWVIAFFVFLRIYHHVKNPVSPIILIIGVVGAIFSGSWLWKHFYNKNTDETVDKTKIKYTSIILAVSLVLSVIGFCTLSFDGFVKTNKEQVMKGVVLNGVDENTTPLAVSDFKLLKKGNDYTIICNLKKNSTEPTEGFFDFSIALVDKNGKHIKKESINSIDNDLPMFTYGSTYHFEREIYISKDENEPVAIEFSDIKEYDKNTYIQTALNKAREKISKDYPESAKNCINKVLEYEPDNAEAKALLEQLSNPNNTPAPSAPAETPQPEKDVLIGTGKDNVRRLLSQYKETKSVMSNNALDFEDNNLLITVYFNSDDIADGVLFMQNSLDGIDTLTGAGSYVSKHYDELVNLATDDPNIKIESDLTLYNSQGVKKEAMELYIGNVPNGNPQSTASSNNTQTEKTKTEPEFEQIVFLNVGMKVYQYKSDDSYLGTIKIVDRDYKDERGKKIGAVYLEGGAKDGWYKREDIVSCYVRSDDPFAKMQ